VEAAPALPEKLFFKIGEVARLTGLKAHVLRYWETEFGRIRPQKSRSGQRLYRRKDVEALLLVKRLLHEERFTIEGAKKKLREIYGPEPGEVPNPSRAEVRARSLESAILEVRGELQKLLRLVGK
jgi:DNA-binding transcriptional MerR regulator